MWNRCWRSWDAKARALFGFGSFAGTAEAFIKAHDYFEEHKDKVPEEDSSLKGFLMDVRSAPRR